MFTLAKYVKKPIGYPIHHHATIGYLTSAR